MKETVEMLREERIRRGEPQGSGCIKSRTRGLLRLLLPWVFCLFLFLPSTLQAVLVNGDFAGGMTGWEGSSAGIYLDNGVAVMTEGEANPVSLVQKFTLNGGTPSLSFSISVMLADNGVVGPQDAFQVSLLNGQGNSLVGAIANFAGVLLSIQQTGEIYYAPEVSIPGAPPSGSSWTSRPEPIFVTINLTGITTDTLATLAFDLINYGTDRSSEVRIDNVQTLAMPIAVNDDVTIPEDTPTNIAVLANDTDPDGPGGKPDPLTSTLTVTTAPSHGTAAVLQADGTIRYTPAPNYAGTDTFSYTVKDNTDNLSNVATVTMTITAVNDPPVADAGPDQSVKEGAVVTLDGSASKDVEDVTPTYAWTQTGGTPSVTLSDAASTSPTFTAPKVQAAGALLTFQLLVRDSGGVESTDTVSIQVNDYVIPCDANDNGSVDLADSIILLREMSRLPNPGVSMTLAADVDGDQRLGMAEVVCTLQHAAGLRVAP